MKHLAIIQARMGSTRLPGKVLKKVKNTTLLEYEISRIKQAKKVVKIVVATSVNEEDDGIQRLCNDIDVDCFRGSSEDVLDRFYKCSLNYPEYGSIIRITGDCPLIDPAIIDEVVGLFERDNLDYASNALIESFPDGLDVEIFTVKSLEESSDNAFLPSEREHVTQYIRKNDKFKKGNLLSVKDLSKIRLTVDNCEDLEVVKFIIERINPNDNLGLILEVLENNPQILNKNSHIMRNEGLQKSLNNDIKFLKQ